MRAIDDVPLTLQDEGVSDMPNLEHGAIGARLARYLDAYVDEHKLGRVFTSQTTFTFVGTPPTRYPDLAFVKQARLPQRLRTVADFAPDLAVEVISENDAVNDVEEKVLQYHQSGVQLVWVIFPLRRRIYVRDSLTSVRVLLEKDELTGEPALPGLRLPVAALFAALAKPQ